MCLSPVVQRNSAMHRMTFPWMRAVTSNTHCGFISFPFTRLYLITLLHAFVLAFKTQYMEFNILLWDLSSQQYYNQANTDWGSPSQNKLIPTAFWHFLQNLGVFILCFLQSQSDGYNFFLRTNHLYVDTCILNMGTSNSSKSYFHCLLLLVQKTGQ